MQKTALACFVLLLGSGCAGNVVDPESDVAVDTFAETSDDTAVEGNTITNPLYAQSAQQLELAADGDNPLF